MRVRCAICNKPVDELAVFYCPAQCRQIMIATCHGQTERRAIDELEFVMDRKLIDKIEDIEGVAFDTPQVAAPENLLLENGPGWPTGGDPASGRCLNQGDGFVLTDPYKTLNVRKNATVKTITKAYRKLSLIHHPDRGGDSDTFAAIVKAYEVLSCPKRRQRYDETGSMDGDGPNDMMVIAHVLNQCLAGVVANIVQQGGDIEKEDMVKHIRDSISQVSTKLRETERAQAVLLGQWKKMAGRWTITDDGVMAGIMESNIKRTEAAIAQIVRELDGLAKTAEFMKSATYRFDPITKRMAWWSTTSTTCFVTY